VALGDQACRRQSQALELPAEPALLAPFMHLKALLPPSIGRAGLRLYRALLNFGR